MEKGLFITGNIGVGKTYKMKSLKTQETSPNRYLTSDQIVDIAMSEGLTAIKNLARVNVVFIDDIGHEPAQVNHFGTVFKPIEEFLKARYVFTTDECNKHYGCRTYVTTNLNVQDIKSRYGDYIFDRILQMCDIEIMKGESKRM